MSREHDRRSVLKAVGATATALVGASGAGGARSLSVTESDARDVLAAEGRDVIEELARRGMLGSPSPEEFDVSNELDRSRIGAGERVDGWMVAPTELVGDRVTHYAYSTTAGEYSITLHVQEERGKSYALVEDTSTGEEFAVDPDTERVVLTNQLEDSTLETEACDDFSDCTCDHCCTPIGCGYTENYYHCFQENRARCECYLDGSACECTCCDGC